jgi:hypothetical protein
MPADNPKLPFEHDAGSGNAVMELPIVVKAAKSM